MSIPIYWGLTNLIPLCLSIPIYWWLKIWPNISLPISIYWGLNLPRILPLYSHHLRRTNENNCGEQLGRHAVAAAAATAGARACVEGVVKPETGVYIWTYLDIYIHTYTWPLRACRLCRHPPNKHSACTMRGQRSIGTVATMASRSTDTNTLLRNKESTLERTPPLSPPNKTCVNCYHVHLRIYKVVHVLLLRTNGNSKWIAR